MKTKIKKGTPYERVLNLDLLSSYNLEDNTIYFSYTDAYYFAVAYSSKEDAKEEYDRICRLDDVMQ